MSRSSCSVLAHIAQSAYLVEPCTLALTPAGLTCGGRLCDVVRAVVRDIGNQPAQPDLVV